MVSVVVPIKTVSALNGREHWRARANRVRGERFAVQALLNSEPKPALPCVVRLTRIGPTNGLDPFDNLPASLKGVADQVAAWLGVSDRNPDLLRFECAQERGRAWGVRIEVEAKEPAHAE